jgi:hypothetical protein
VIWTILCMRISGGAQPLSCSHQVDDTSIPLIFQLNLIPQRFFLEDKIWHFSRASLTLTRKIKAFFLHISSLQIIHLPLFKILWISPILASNLVHENSTTNIECDALKTIIFKGLGGQG